MAKLKAPLLSLGASQAIGKALVFFNWKGLDVVREYVVPANPRTALQVTQRGYVTAAVADVHTAQAEAVGPLGATDISAYALWAAVVKAATTWFNQCVKNHIDQAVAGLTSTVIRGGVVTAGVGSLTLDGFSDEIGLGTITAANVWYGTSRTALIHSVAATIVLATSSFNAIIPGLVAGTKYFIQFRPTAPAGAVGINSGIYYGYPT